MLRESDHTLDFAVWTNNFFLEIFLMGGRLVCMVPLPCEAIAGGAGAGVIVSAVSDESTQAVCSSVELLNAAIWGSRQPHLNRNKMMHCYNPKALSYKVFTFDASLHDCMRLLAWVRKLLLVHSFLPPIYPLTITVAWL